MQDEHFEWDDAKAAQNVARHKVSFETARKAFDDVLGIEVVDDREDYGEERFNLLGMVADRLLHVTFTVRAQRARLISARIAEPAERRRYHEENSQD